MTAADVTAFLAAIDYTHVVAGIVGAGMALLIPLIARKGVRMVLGMVR